MAPSKGTATPAGHEDATFWAAVRTDYENPAFSLDEICVRHGLTRSQFYRYRKANNWPKRIKAAARPNRPSVKKKQRTTQRPARHSGKLQRRIAMIDRLYAVLEQELQDFENTEFSDMEVQTSAARRADRERSARTLTSLIRSFDKICEFDDKARQASQPARTEDESTGDADGLRREIAQRLERLLASHAGRGDSAKPDGG